MTSISASYPVSLPPLGGRTSASAAASEPPVGKTAALATDEASTKAKASEQASTPTRSTGELDPAQLDQLRELQAIDRKVRAHEAAHAAVAGNLGGAKSFSYVTGPDGVRYAVGGEVGISFGGESSPEATLENAAQVRAAALAPIDPSPQDLRVAARAQQLIQQAQLELGRERTQGSSARDEGGASATTISDNPKINAFRSVADAATTRTPQLDFQA